MRLWFRRHKLLILCYMIVGETVDLCAPDPNVLAELCITVNETVSLVNFGAGSWSFLLGKESNTNMHMQM